MSTSLTSAGINFPDNTTTTTNLLPSGTRLVFHNSSAPTGWTRDTSINDTALRVVSGSTGAGGSTGFASALGSPSVSGSVSLSGEPGSGNLSTSISGNVNIGSTTLSTTQMPSHGHTLENRGNVGFGGNTTRVDAGVNSTDDRNDNTYARATLNNQFIQSTGGSSSHNHNAGHNLSGAISGSPDRGTLSASLSSASTSINVKYQDVMLAQKD